MSGTVIFSEEDLESMSSTELDRLIQQNYRIQILGRDRRKDRDEDDGRGDM